MEKAEKVRVVSLCTRTKEISEITRLKFRSSGPRYFEPLTNCFTMPCFFMNTNISPACSYSFISRFKQSTSFYRWKSRNKIPFEWCSGKRGLNSLPHNPEFLRLQDRSLLKTLWEKEKMLVTTNVSFSRDVFYPIKDRNHHLSYIYFVACNCFQYGHV